MVELGLSQRLITPDGGFQPANKGPSCGGNRAISVSALAAPFTLTSESPDGVRGYSALLIELLQPGLGLRQVVSRLICWC